MHAQLLSRTRVLVARVDHPACDLRAPPLGGVPQRRHRGVVLLPGEGRRPSEGGVAEIADGGVVVACEGDRPERVGADHRKEPLRNLHPLGRRHVEDHLVGGIDPPRGQQILQTRSHRHGHWRLRIDRVPLQQQQRRAAILQKVLHSPHGTERQRLGRRRHHQHIHRVRHHRGPERIGGQVHGRDVVAVGQALAEGPVLERFPGLEPRHEGQGGAFGHRHVGDR